jgi:hypothetical protein
VGLGGQYEDDTESSLEDGASSSEYDDEDTDGDED